MLALTIDDPQIENYFANSADKLKEFISNFVKNQNSSEKEYLQKELQDIKSGNASMMTEEDFWNSTDEVLSKY